MADMAGGVAGFVAIMRDPLQRYRFYLDETDKLMIKAGFGKGNWQKLCDTRSALITEIVKLQLERFDRSTTI